ncbi:DUF885 domain-containing protein [Trujillonella endophytica]|uniref:Uncharacterized conserved protein, DUF885 familyt n=1 Tax=Trujillonella endophytica TaxID=673521 RepID=A0A1H8RF31_9ACTN|nr:DUF885 domain-containing protein [Trujillella endophytica]SEO65035.1 Uncharacterized conserved protein, DUF885 familyt [Trujillella endophytica]
MSGPAPTPRQVADRYVAQLCRLDPLVATSLGDPAGADRLPDPSPAGLEARAELARRTLAELAAAPATDPGQRRCARLLRERLGADLALHDAGEGLRELSHLFSPVHAIRQVFMLMPASTGEDWSVLARRMAQVPGAYRGFVATLREGAGRGLLVAPRQVTTVLGQLETWLSGPWFGTFAAAGPAALRRDLDAAAAAADGAVAEVRDFLRDEYLPRAEGTPDAVGRERYALAARRWTGAELGAGRRLEEAYAFGWDEHRRLLAEQRRAAGEALEGAGPREAMEWAQRHGPAVAGVEATRAYLQGVMDRAIDALDGVHFDIAPPLRRVEAVVSPPGSAAGAYYTQPSQDFARPGRTWLPVLGRERFPLWDLVSIWYHEGVPGHHLQLAQWVLRAGELSTFQTSVGMVGADIEGWALYAERLMDELGYLTEPWARLGYLDGQQLRAMRVVVDLGMHLGLPVPADADGVLADARGRPWTPELARAFLGEHSGSTTAFLDSELVRYLGVPGQAISYKLGERAWLAGRAAARRNRGGDFDLRAWHMAALSQGSLGLDDLESELAVL